MSGTLPLNTASAHTWAAVVSGASWKRHTLTPGGLLAAEYTRGPLILWAKTAKEDVRSALAPAGPSPLEAHLSRVNAAPAFRRFWAAARGRVRPSVRWKTGRARRVRKVEALEDLWYAALTADRRAEGQRGIMGRPGSKTAKAKREARQAAEREALEDRARALAPAHWEDDSSGIDRARVALWDEWGGLTHWASGRPDFAVSFSPFDSAVRRALHVFEEMPRAERARAAAYFAMLRRWDELAAFLARYFRPALAAQVLYSLRAVALGRLPQRRVRVRRWAAGRIPRPLYARPRPPAAPLAPPV